jgi:hypothetical protein
LHFHSQHCRIHMRIQLHSVPRGRFSWWLM